MGIMPVDRAQNWHSLFRRFGLPGDLPEKEPADKASGRRNKSEPKAPDRDKRPAMKPDR